MDYKIRIEKDKVYLGKLDCRICLPKFNYEEMVFAADVDYCSPLTPAELRNIADQIDELNRGDR